MFGRGARASLLVALLALPILAAPARSASPDPLREEFVQDGLGREIDATLTRWASYGFSGTVLLERGGVIWLHKSYGEADRTEARPNRTDSPFPADPLIRQLITLSILRLEMESRLSTTDRLEVHFDSVLESERGRTLHDLLCDRAANPDRLNEILRRAAGGAVDSVLSATILDPAGMHATGRLGDSLAAHPVSGHHVAKSHLRAIRGLPAAGWWIDRFGSSLARAASTSHPVQPGPGILPLSPFVTTAADLYQLDLALRGDRLLNADARQKLYNPIANDRSYGWVFSRTLQGRSRVAHEREGDGTEIGVYRYPDDQMVLILLVNTDMGWRRPVRDFIERASFSGGSLLVFAAASAIVLYIILRTSINRRAGQPWFARRAKRRIPR